MAFNASLAVLAHSEPLEPALLMVLFISLILCSPFVKATPSALLLFSFSASISCSFSNWFLRILSLSSCHFLSWSLTIAPFLLFSTIASCVAYWSSKELTMDCCVSNSVLDLKNSSCAVFKSLKSFFRPFIVLAISWNGFLVMLSSVIFAKALITSFASVGARLDKSKLSSFSLMRSKVFVATKSKSSNIFTYNPLS